jgi:hypothetical protein
MATRRPAGVFRRIVDVKPGERKLAALIFSYFFLIAAPYTIINALRTSNFLFKEGVGWLPVVYLLAFGLTGLVVFLYSRICVRKSVRALIISSLVFLPFRDPVPGALRSGLGGGGFLNISIGLGECADHRPPTGF